MPRLLTVTSDAGAPDEITATSSPALTDLVAGAKILFTPAATNTSNTVTLAVDGLPAGQVYTSKGSVLPIGGLRTNTLYECVWAGSSWRLTAPLRAPSLTLGSTDTDSVPTANQVTDLVRRIPAQLVLSGGANAWTAVATPSLASLSGYPVGAKFTIRALATTNTGNVTINIDGLGALSLLTIDGAQIPAGALRSGANYSFTVHSSTVARLDAPLRATSSMLVYNPSDIRHYITPGDAKTLFDAYLTAKTLQVTESDAGYNAINPNAQIFAVSPATTTHTRGNKGSISFTTVPTTDSFTVDLGAGAKPVVNNEGSSIGTRIRAGDTYDFVCTSSTIRLTTPVKPLDADVATSRSSTLRPTVNQVVALSRAMIRESGGAGLVDPTKVSTPDLLRVGGSVTYRYGSTWAGLPGPIDGIFPGSTVYNAGNTGRTTIGGTRYLNASDDLGVTFVGNQIPASGAVGMTWDGITNDNDTPLWGSGRNNQACTVTVGSTTITGTVRRISASANYEFERDTAGSVIDTSGGATLIITGSQACRGYTILDWDGRNNASDTAQIIADTIRRLNWQTGDVRRYLRGTILTGPTDDSGKLAAVQATNAALVSNFGLAKDGGIVVDLLGYLMDLGPLGAMATVGLTPDSNDTADVAAGYPPRALRLAVDDLHLNDHGYRAVDICWAKALLNRGGWR